MLPHRLRRARAEPCSSGGISYAVVSGAPPGVHLSRLDYLSGVPREEGSFELAVRVANGCTWTTKHFILTAAPVEQRRGVANRDAGAGLHTTAGSGAYRG